MTPKEAARTVHLAGFLVTFPSGSSLPSSVPSLRGLRSATRSAFLPFLLYTPHRPPSSPNPSARRAPPPDPWEEGGRVNGVNEGRPWDRVSPRLVVSSLLRFSVRHVPHVLHPRYARLRDERGTARDERRPNRVSGEDRRVTEDPARSEVTRRVTKGAN